MSVGLFSGTFYSSQSPPMSWLVDIQLPEGVLGGGGDGGEDAQVFLQCPHFQQGVLRYPSAFPSPTVPYIPIVNFL